VSDFESIAAQAARLGYSLQCCLATDQMRGIVQLPEHFDHVWVLCNVGDTVQRRWLGDQSPEERAAAYAQWPSETSGPLDEFCRSELSGLLADTVHEFLFPLPRRAPTPPLVALLDRLGLYRSSPIMSSLHGRFGSWWAVRAVIALRGPVVTAPQASLESDPCVGCPAPCVSACPSGAVTRDGWRWDRCAAERCSDGSDCADRCLARLVCPAGEPFRYSDPVVRYHYLASLPSLCAAQR